MSIREDVSKMKLVSPYVAAMSVEKRNEALLKVSEVLQENKEAIFTENKKDLEAAEKAGIAQATFKRLKFNEDKLKDVVKGIQQLVTELSLKPALMRWSRYLLFV